MRDTGDIMEDALSEDTMMDCGGDEALYDLIDLSTDISHSAPTIKDAAERLLTLLGMENDFDEDVFSSSEDEGVDLDECSDSEDSDSEENTPNTRLLHSLAASLAEELKYSQKQVSPTGTNLRLSSSRVVRTVHEITRDDQTMEIAESSPQDEVTSRNPEAPKTAPSRGFYGASNFELDASSISPTKFRSETHFRTATHDQEEKNISAAGETTNFNCWAAGWDACAAEALRYLVEEEKLLPHHPTVTAMKKHLEIQRERAFAQFSI